MTGVDIIAARLLAAPGVTSLVPVANIKQGALPENAPLPALLLRSVSAVELLTLKRGAVVRYVERVSVAVRAASYRDQVAVMKAVLAAAAGWTGDMAPAMRIAITSAGKGPDLRGPGNSFEQTRDFKVLFDDHA